MATEKDFVTKDDCSERHDASKFKMKIIAWVIGTTLTLTIFFSGAATTAWFTAGQACTDIRVQNEKWEGVEKLLTQRLNSIEGKQVNLEVKQDRMMDILLELKKKNGGN